jgi:hypothetical protein
MKTQIHPIADIKVLSITDILPLILQESKLYKVLVVDNPQISVENILELILSSVEIEEMMLRSYLIQSHQISKEIRRSQKSS